MNVRSASFRDLARVEQLYRERSPRTRAAPGPHPDSPVPQATLLRLWYALGKTLSSLVPLSDTGGVLFVAEDDAEGVVGFIQAQGTSTRPSVWQIVNLCVAPGGAGHFARERLLTHLCNRGLEQGVHRFHVRLPLDHPLVGVFLEHGFTQFATEQILFHDNPEQIAQRRRRSRCRIRPARREDAGGHPPALPAGHAEPHRQLRGAVAEDVAGVVRPGKRGAHRPRRGQALRRRAARGGRLGGDPARRRRPPDHPLADVRGARPRGPRGLPRRVLAELPPQPVSCVLRHYDSELIRSLQQRGFAVYGTQLLLVRDLGIKVRIRAAAKQSKQVLAHAGVASSHVSAPSLTVLRPPERRER